MLSLFLVLVFKLPKNVQYLIMFLITLFYSFSNRVFKLPKLVCVNANGGQITQDTISQFSTRVLAGFNPIGSQKTRFYSQKVVQQSFLFESLNHSLFGPLYQKSATIKGFSRCSIFDSLQQQTKIFHQCFSEPK